jgi:hypothetical protein
MELSLASLSVPAIPVSTVLDLCGRSIRDVDPSVMLIDPCS